MQARISEALKPWQKGRRRYTDHIKVADAFLRRIGALHGDPIHRLVEWVIAAEPISQSSAVKRMRDYRKYGRQKDLDAVLAPLMWSAMRPLMRKPIYDDIFEDAFQDSMVSIIEYLRGMDIDPIGNWQTLRSYPAMNARTHALLDTVCVAKPPRSRDHKKLYQAFERNGANISYLCDDGSWAIIEDNLEASQQALLTEMRNFIAGGAESSTTHADPWQDLNGEPDFCIFSRSDLHLDLMRLIKWAEYTLKPRDFDVLCSKLLDSSEPSLKEIATPYGLTEERIRQIYREILITLREAWQKDLHHKTPARPNAPPTLTPSARPFVRHIIPPSN